VANALQRSGPGITRVVMAAGGSDFDTPSGDLVRTLSGKGYGLIFPRSENRAGDVLRLYPTPGGAVGLPIQLARGGRYMWHWEGGGLTIRRTLGRANDCVVYVVDDPEAGFIEGSEDVGRLSNSGYLVNGLDVASASSPTIASVNVPGSGDGVGIDLLSSISLFVADGNSTSSSGTVIRPWWYLPGVSVPGGLSWNIPETAGGFANGWIPDAFSYTVADYTRVFGFALNTRTGNTGGRPLTPSGLGGSWGGNLVGAAVFFQFTSIPASARPLLYVTAEAES
jgi:hypothetical protein